MSNGQFNQNLSNSGGQQQHHQQQTGQSQNAQIPLQNPNMQALQSQVNKMGSMLQVLLSGLGQINP